MADTTSRNNARLSFRLNERHKKLIERAARSAGQTVTEYAVSELIAKARETLHKSHTTELSQRDSELFLTMLDSDAEPNEALKRAARTYRRQRV
jgi:uncharacterized protein (DUF1778 family)